MEIPELTCRSEKNSASLEKPKNKQKQSRNVCGFLSSPVFSMNRDIYGKLAFLSKLSQ